MQRDFAIPAGERTRVIRSVTSSIPRTFRLTAERPGGGPVSGVVEVHGSRWLFRKPSVDMPLASAVEVSRGFWDTLFSVYVTPDHDVRVEVR